MTKMRRTLSLLLGLGVALVVPGCGSSNSSPTSPTVAAPVRELVGQGNFNLLSVPEANAVNVPFDAEIIPLVTTVAGSIEVDADWTFPSSIMGLGIFPGTCAAAQVVAQNCGTELGSLGPPSPKPGKLTINNVAAGTYTVIIANAGSNHESGNFQVYITH